MLKYILLLYLIISEKDVIHSMEMDAYKNKENRQQEEVPFESIKKRRVKPLDPYEYADLCDQAFDQKKFEKAAYYLILSAATGHSEHLSFLTELDKDVKEYLNFPNAINQTSKIIQLEELVQKELKKQAKRIES